ncbi:MAG: App1 family protein [Xanthomonadaceae bacterium]|nr:App1 family protein [Xanthomonadaceae bacterium]
MIANRTIAIRTLRHIVSWSARVSFRARSAACALALVGLSATIVSNAAAPAPQATDERLALYPTTVRVLADGHLALRIDAWVYERETRPGARTLLARYLKLDRDALDEEQRARFDARTQWFRADSERGKTVRIFDANGGAYRLPRTGSAGRSGAELTLPPTATDDPMWVTVRGVLLANDGSERGSPVIGRALRVPQAGISLVSDIDDTIKDSKVLDRRELLLNTFVRPFVAVNGMAARYRAFADERADLRVHYVSGGPHQLHATLSDFLDAERFPGGSLHLRDIAIGREIFGEKAGETGGTRTHKLKTIRRLIADFPQRRFVMIGDSGEQDPEIYATLAREYPDRVLAIWIRDVTGQSRDHARYRAAFAGVDPTRWRVFTDSAEIVLPPEALTAR